METYNDGVLRLFEDISERTSFGAKKNEENMNPLCKLDFCGMSQRQKDLEFAEQSGFSLSLKVKTRFCPLVKRNKKYKALIGTSLYDISYFDVTKANLFFYLEYIREVGDGLAAGS